MTERTIDQDEVLDLVNCAETYGHWNSVCMVSLYDFAEPITDDDIKRYALSLTDSEGYGDEDREESIERLTKWRDKYAAITNGE
jgi:hypothetical protein